MVRDLSVFTPMLAGLHVKAKPTGGALNP